MAGTGSRLRGVADIIAKPLIPIGGRPLISYAIQSFSKIGVKRVHAVVGPNGERLAAAVAPLFPRRWSSVRSRIPIGRNKTASRFWPLPEKSVRPFFLAMGDHLFESSILDQLIAQADFARLNLAIDRKIDSIFDLDDAMKVQTRDDNLIGAIGKKLGNYNAIDTGIFLCPEIVFDYLRRALKGGDCSLADGVRLMAAEGKALAVDIGEAWWQDVDTPEMLARAEQEVARLLLCSLRPSLHAEDAKAGAA